MFSELVDRIVIRSGRPDKILDITAHANSTLREMQGLALFWRDLIEDQIVPTAGVNSYSWTVPNNFRRLRAVKYSSHGYENQYPPLLRPGKVQRGSDVFYYSAGNYFVFSGLGGQSNQTVPNIDLAYWITPRRFKYYDQPSRPAVYDTEADDWDPALYNPVLTGTPDQQLAQAEVQQELVANWVLQKYSEFVEEGTLAKILKVVGDDRAGSSFALYKSFQGTLITLEASESLDQLPEGAQ